MSVVSFGKHLHLEQTAKNLKIGDINELRQALADARAQKACLLVAAPGAPPETGGRQVVHLDLSGLNNIREHSVPDQVISVETGMTVAQLNQLLSKHGQFFPARVPARWSVLEALAGAESGSLEHGYGGMRDLVLGCELLLADGTAIKCGGRVVKNVTGYDLTKLIVGSRNWLAIPLTACLRLYALPQTSTTFSWTFDSMWKLMACARALTMSGLPLAALEAVSNDNQRLGRGRYALLCQVLSLKTVTDEVTQALLQLAGPAEFQLAGQPSDAFWQELAELFLGSPGENALQVVAAPSMVPDIVSALPPASRWSARPLRGRVAALVENAAEALAALKKLSNANGQQLTVATADAAANFRVHRLPREDSAKQSLIMRIKEELDPSLTLNPFVVL